MKRGDRYVYRVPGCDPALVEITRVARAGTWADIWCHDGAQSWTKRQPLPLPQFLEAEQWTAADLVALKDLAVARAILRDPE